MTYYKKILHSLIPGGAHTYSRGDDQYSSNTPPIFVKGKDCFLYDTENNKFLDFGMALRSVTLGYANKFVNRGAIEQINNGVNLTRASMIELEAAKLITNIIDSADMVKFAKNGSNVTTAAVKLSRAYTGKEYVCIPTQHPFFSFDDWFIGAGLIRKGIPSEHYSKTLFFEYGNIDSLKELFNKYHNNIAAVMLEPSTNITPCENLSCNNFSFNNPCFKCPNNKNNFLKKVQDLCNKNNTVFILDEMITGFRWDLKGAQKFFGVTPDLSTFGKGMANGFALAALTGKKEIMNLGGILEKNMERTFLLSTTHGSEMPAFGAFIAAMEFYKKNNVIKHLWETGKYLRTKFNSLSDKYELTDYFYITGNDISMNIITKDINKNISMAYRTYFLQEMIKEKIMIPWIAISYAHKKKHIDFFLSKLENFMTKYSNALNGDINKLIKGDIVKPVFRKYN